MFISNKYLEDTFKLVSSFVIKLHNIAVSININLTELGLPIDNVENVDELAGWKYYMNLAGEYHISDLMILSSKEYPTLNGKSGIIFTSLDDGNKYILTKEILAYHPATRLKLEEQGEYYVNLISSYPIFESLIKGITYPVDINEAVKAKDGTVLNYNSAYVDRNEYSLIDSVEEELYRFLMRWDVKEYTISDDLYSASLFMNITTAALYKVINHRLAMIGTYEANSFHIKELFKSSFGINEDADILTYSGRIWLYKNIKNIIRNVGKEETLNSIIENIIYPSEIEVEEIMIRTKDPVLIENNVYDIEKEYYKKSDENLYRKKHHSIDNVLSEIPLEYVINKELESTESIIKSATNKNDYIASEKDKIKLIKNQSERTKVLNIKFKKYLDLFNINHITIVLDNWFYYAFNSAASVKTLYFSNQLLGAVSLSHKEAALLVMWMLVEATNKKDVKVSNYKTNTVLRPITEEEVRSIVILPEDVLESLMGLITEIPTYNNIYTVEKFVIYVNAVEDWLFKYSVFKSNLNAAYSGKLDAVLERLTLQNTITISQEPETLENILYYNTSFNGVFKEDYDPMLIVEELVKLFTGITLDNRRSKDEILKGYANILKALTSYTVHFIKDEVGEKISGEFNLIDSLKEVNLTRILDGTYKCLEDFKGSLMSDVDDGREFTRSASTNAISYLTIKDDINITSMFIPQDRVIGITHKLKVKIS